MKHNILFLEFQMCWFETVTVVTSGLLIKLGQAQDISTILVV